MASFDANAEQSRVLLEERHAPWLVPALTEVLIDDATGCLGQLVQRSKRW